MYVYIYNYIYIYIYIHIHIYRYTSMGACLVAKQLDPNPSKYV